MIVVFKIFFLILFFYSKPIVASDNCISENNIKIGLINNEFIDYQYYLYYELGNYARENDIDFENKENYYNAAAVPIWCPVHAGSRWLNH